MVQFGFPIRVFFADMHRFWKAHLLATIECTMVALFWSRIHTTCHGHLLDWWLKQRASNFKSPQTELEFPYFMTPSNKDADCIFTSPCEVQLYLNLLTSIMFNKFSETQNKNKQQFSNSSHVWTVAIVGSGSCLDPRLLETWPRCMIHWGLPILCDSG